MSKPSWEFYHQGFKLLHKNLYIFWIYLLIAGPITYSATLAPAQLTVILTLSPVILATLRLANTQLLYLEPQGYLKISETYVKVFAKFFFRVLFIGFVGINLSYLIFVLCGGDLTTLKLYTEALSKTDATLAQKIISILPFVLASPIVPYAKIYWTIKQHSFIRSVTLGTTYAIKHIQFTIIPSLISLILIVIQHPFTQSIHKINPFVFITLNAYLGLIVSSAATIYFKSHKVER